ncbi:hypothetical protein LXA43DRAFT_974333 [Ganoderma leucocontextum]|nr:hypothetical protein LXA43DRAFT_974333 [Ganoderma leucocontextum]
MEGPEEVILRVQGYLIDAMLPPVRQYHIPHNANRIINMKQAVTLTGLGVEHFDKDAHLICRRCQLCDWKPGHNGEDLMLTFTNRYLTPSILAVENKDAQGETPFDLAELIDPLNILRPHLRSEVHIQENVVEYWQRSENNVFSHIKPDMFNTGNLVEVQVGFVTVRLSRQEYIFLPRLRALCLLSHVVEKDYNNHVIQAISSKPVSPLTKVKRKVGYADRKDEEALFVRW